MNNEIFRSRLIFAGIIVVTFILGGYLWQKNMVVAPTIENQAPNTVEINNPEVITAYLEIEGIYTDEVSVQAVQGQTILGLMQQINSSDLSLNLETQDYPGLGSLVVQIGSWRNGDDNKYWQYEVNDTVPMIGADQYIVNPGDKIKWEFKESEY